MSRSSLATLAIAIVALCVVAGKPALPDDVVDSIKIDEGFRGMPYDDSRGVPTLGFGTRLPITRAEGELLLKHRLVRHRALHRRRVQGMAAGV